MKAIPFDQYGPPEVLALVDIDEPHAHKGQIRIAVRAARGALRIPVQRTFSLADAQAHNAAGHAAGRTVVVVPRVSARH